TSLTLTSLPVLT
ncbi:unnamed protein product, partial [Rotaria sordida]